MNLTSRGHGSRETPVPDVVFAIPGDITAKTGGYIYDRRVMDFLPEVGWRPHHLVLPGDFPLPSKASLGETERRLAHASPSDALVLVDGLAYGALPADLIRHTKRRIVALVHHPLSLEAGISAERAAHFARSEREALAQADHVIVTSPSTGELLVSDFDVPWEKITVAEPGTNPAPRARGSLGPPRLLSVGSVTEHKGYGVLIKALAQIADLPWQSHIVGSLDRDPDMVKSLRDTASNTGLAQRVILRGALNEAELNGEYAEARLFVLPSYFEGYGMAFTEAMTRGLPVVACAAGAVPKTVPADAGVLVPPGDADALAQALRRLLTNRNELEVRANAAWAYGQTLPRWRDTANRVAGGLTAVLKKAS
jgi:glycosyltransferase involved in cell wall biosynthesis